MEFSNTLKQENEEMRLLLKQVNVLFGNLKPIMLPLVKKGKMPDLLSIPLIIKRVGASFDKSFDGVNLEDYLEKLEKYK